MAELLDFLKYGAIGIALALAALSYRLLSREQDKTEVRVPMLNSIKLYFLFSLLLSLLFSGVELYSVVVGGGKATNSSELHDLHTTFLKNRTDSTDVQKQAALTAFVRKLQRANRDYAQKIDSLDRQEQHSSLDFYKNISDLSAQINRYGGINLVFESDSKGEVFKTINSLFISLELCDNYFETDREVIDRWKQLKASWNNTSFNWVYNSDVGILVQHYLKIQNNNKN